MTIMEMVIAKSETTTEEVADDLVSAMEEDRQTAVETYAEQGSDGVSQRDALRSKFEV